MCGVTRCAQDGLGHDNFSFGSREVTMDSYGIATVFRSRRHDSFNRKLADDLARRDSKGGVFIESGNNNNSKEFPGNWMRQGLAHIKKQGA
jgi:hypothetical protein